MSLRIIKDIRVYESEIPNIEGNSLPASLGTIYPMEMTRRLNCSIMRIVRKLNEYDLVTGDYDHIYINFTTLMKSREFSVSKRKIAKWMIYIDYGLDSDELLNLTEDEKIEFFINLIFDILEELFKNNESNLNIISKVKEQYFMYGTNLEIIHKRKETKTYKIIISYIIGQDDVGSYVNLEYINLKNNMQFKKKIINLKRTFDVHYLIGSIVVKGQYVEIRPLNSAIAKVTNTRYETPIRICLD